MKIVVDGRPPGRLRGLTGTLLTCLVLASSGAAHGVDYYVTTEVDFTKLDIGSLSFNPQMARLKLSGIMDKGAMKGVGLEAVVGAPFADDEKNDLTASIENHYGLYVSFTDYRRNALNFTISLGYTSTDIKAEWEGNGNEVEETFQSGSFSLSLHNSIGDSKNFFWLVDCTHYLKVDDIQMGGCGAGVKYGF